MIRKILFVIVLLCVGVSVDAQRKIYTNQIEVRQKMKLKGYSVDGVSNDTLLAGRDSSQLVTEHAVKTYVDNGKQIVYVSDTTGSLITGVEFYKDTLSTPDSLYWHDGNKFKYIGEGSGGGFVPDGVTITPTGGAVDTSLIATKTDLLNVSVDTVLELATKYDIDTLQLGSTELADGVTILGTGGIGDSLRVDTINEIATKRDARYHPIDSTLHDFEFSNNANQITPDLPAYVYTTPTEVFGITAFSETTNRMFIFYRSGAQSEQSDGEIYQRYSDDFGNTWTDEALVYGEAGKNTTNIAGGVTPTGRVVLFFSTYSPSPPAASLVFDGIFYIYSDDDGVTWSAKSTLNTGAETIYSAYGKMETLQNGTLAQSWYSQAVGDFNVRIVYSTDNGITWGNQVTLPISSTETETDILAIRDSSMIAISRKDGVPNFHLCYSPNYGVTWEEIGELNIFTGITNQAPCWIEKYPTTSGEEAIAMYFYDRSVGANEMLVAYALSRDILTKGVDAFRLETKRKLFYNTTGVGYPSAVHPYGNSLGIGWVGVSNNIRFFHSNEGTGIGQWNGTKLAVGGSNPISDLDIKGNVTVGKNYTGIDAPIDGMIVEGTVGLGESVHTGNLPAQLVVRSGAIQQRLKFDDSNYSDLRTMSNGQFSLIATGGRYGLGTSTMVREFHFHNPLSSVSRLRLSHTGTGLYSGVDLSLDSGNSFVFTQLTGGAIKFTTTGAYNPRFDTNSRLQLGNLPNSHSEGDRWLHVEALSSATDSIAITSVIEHETDAAIAIGLGVGDEMKLTKADGQEVVVARQHFEWTDVTNAIEKGNLVFSVFDPVTDQIENKMSISSNGNVRFSDYGGGTITGTPTKYLAVEADGDVIEVDGVSDNLYTADGTLTENRIVNLNTDTLNFSNGLLMADGYGLGNNSDGSYSYVLAPSSIDGKIGEFPLSALQNHTYSASTSTGAELVLTGSELEAELNIGGLTEDTSPITSTTYVPIQTGAFSPKKIKIDDLFTKGMDAYNDSLEVVEAATAQAAQTASTSTVGEEFWWRITGETGLTKMRKE